MQLELENPEVWSDPARAQQLGKDKAALEEKLADQSLYDGSPQILTALLKRKGDPAKGFKWTYLFVWGLEDIIGSFLALWDGMETNKVIGGLFPNDADGKKLIPESGDLILTGGTISLQSESHPCEFRKVELMVIEE